MAARQEVCQVPAEAEASNVADAMEGNKPDEEPTVKEELENDSGAQDSHGDDCPCLDDNNEGPPIKKDYTPEALHAQFLIRKAEYQKSDCHKRMADLLKSKTPPAGWAITKAMAFGLGSFSNICPCGDPTMHSERSLNQLAAFLTIVEQIQEKNRFTVKMFAQDPEFNSSEKMFLKNLGFQVIEDLNGQPMVDGKTFTYCPFLPNCVWPDIICQRQAPALYITDQQQAAIDAIWIDTERAGDIFADRNEARMALGDYWSDEEEWEDMLECSLDKLVVLRKRQKAMIRFLMTHKKLRLPECHISSGTGLECPVCLTVYMPKAIVASCRPVNA